MNKPQETTVTLGPLEDMRVRFWYSPGRPGRMYLSNGDPGYPDEPAELAIEEVLVRDKWLPVSAFEAASEWIEAAEEDLMERIVERERDQQAAMWEDRERDYYP
jgi:hypothetical protein